MLGHALESQASAASGRSSLRNIPPRNFPARSMGGGDSNTDRADAKGSVGARRLMRRMADDGATRSADVRRGVNSEAFKKEEADPSSAKNRPLSG